ncbi:MAG: hypothetical protein LBV16_03375, partial [Elusimicrobiota bacterium]|nr:hypothetical protein [Elusimicrobiota bacterium]
MKLDVFCGAIDCSIMRFKNEIEQNELSYRMYYNSLKRAIDYLCYNPLTTIHKKGYKNENQSSGSCF